jgi:hypothetical protein
MHEADAHSYRRGVGRTSSNACGRTQTTRFGMASGGRPDTTRSPNDQVICACVQKDAAHLGTDAAIGAPGCINIRCCLVPTLSASAAVGAGLPSRIVVQRAVAACGGHHVLLAAVLGPPEGLQPACYVRRSPRDGRPRSSHLRTALRTGRRALPCRGPGRLAGRCSLSGRARRPGVHQGPWSRQVWHREVATRSPRSPPVACRCSPFPRRCQACGTSRLPQLLRSGSSPLCGHLRKCAMPLGEISRKEVPAAVPARRSATPCGQEPRSMSQSSQ